MTDQEIDELEKLLIWEQAQKAKEDFTEFNKLTLPNIELTEFHRTYYGILNRFANKEIKKLIISVPPQHGKSEGSSRKLPAYLLGKDPNNKIAILSYSGPFAQGFNRDIKRTIISDEYKEVFPDTKINEKAVVTSEGSKNTKDEFEIVGHRGKLKTVGVGGGLTGETVDTMIIDDLYKGYKEAVSPSISQSTWEWYLTVSKTRLHNDSQEIIVFTRWDEKDIVGRLEKLGKVIDASDCESLEDAIEKAGSTKYIKINFEAIKTGKPNFLDKRKEGEPLYPSKHSKEKLIDLRSMDPPKFSALFQGQPKTKEGLLYSGFATYKSLPALKIRRSMTDTADEGDDYLCSIAYGVPEDPQDQRIYILDVLFTTDKMEITEPLTAKMIERNDCRENNIESNNGGKGFARNIEKILTYRHAVNWFTQTENKFARIYTNAASVNRAIVFPDGWHNLWPEFYDSITDYKKENVNDHDDGPDVITAIYELESNESDFFIV